MIVIYAKVTGAANKRKKRNSDLHQSINESCPTPIDRSIESNNFGRSKKLQKMTATKFLKVILIVQFLIFVPDVVEADDEVRKHFSIL